MLGRKAGFVLRCRAARQRGAMPNDPDLRKKVQGWAGAPPPGYCARMGPLGQMALR
jgi:hypothetical protein